jgi:hypothetical protein
MSELYLVAHKVRGEPAFDIATRIECAECKQDNGNIPGCSECDGLGYWWIIPTSGHRAYPWRWWGLDHLRYQSQAEVQDWDDVVQPMDEIQNGVPDHLPDHYPTRSASTPSLTDILGLRKPKPATPPAPIVRRL